MARPVVVKGGSIDVSATLRAQAKAMHEQLDRDTKRGRRVLQEVARARGVEVMQPYGIADGKPRFMTFLQSVVDGESAAFALIGAPRTKKNHGKVVVRTVRGKKRRFHVPSDAYVSWCASVVAQLLKVRPLPNRPYNCAAVFYRDADRGDAVGYYQGLADALQAAGVVSDDKLITQWDGSRLRVDRTNPRVELTLTPVEE